MLCVFPFLGLLASWGQRMTADRPLALARIWRFTLRTFAIALAVVFVGWNAFWLCQFQGPPSLMKALTGLPAPTTGITRSLKQLLSGNWLESVRYNAMLAPIGALLVLTLGLLAWQLFRRQRLAMPRWTVLGWGIVLIAAWVLKLAGDPNYW